MLKVFFAILLAAMGISQARVTFPDISKAAGAVPRVFSVIDRKSAIDSSEPTGITQFLKPCTIMTYAYLIAIIDMKF